MELRLRDHNALVRGVLLLALTGLLLHLILEGRLSEFIHPRFAWFTASSGAGLLVMAVGQLRSWARGGHLP